MVTANEYRVLSEGDKHVLKLLKVMVAQLCEYTKKHLTVYFKSNWMACELYLNKNVISPPKKDTELVSR